MMRGSPLRSAGTAEQETALDQTALTLAELQSALLLVGRLHSDTAIVMRSACAVLDELTAKRSEMKVRAVAGRAHLNQGNTREAMRMFDSIEKIAGHPGQRYTVPTITAG